MRRLAVLAVLLSAALAPLGCAGEEGRRAEALLERSSRALAEVDSLRFAGRLWMETPAGDFAFVVRGGASAQGGGSSFVTMRGENVPGFPEVSVVTRGTSCPPGRTWGRAGSAASCRPAARRASSSSTWRPT